MQDRKLSRAVAPSIYIIVIGLLLSVAPAWAQEPARQESQSIDPDCAQNPTSFKIFPSLRTSFLPKSRYEKALTVIVKDSEGRPICDATVKAEVHSADDKKKEGPPSSDADEETEEEAEDEIEGGDENDAGDEEEPEDEADMALGKIELFTDMSAEGGKTADAWTDYKGLANFGIVTGELGEDRAKQDFEILVRVTVAGAPNPREEIVQGVVFAKPQQALGSDRVSFEMFTGTTLARAYDEEGKSTGFDEASMVGRLRFDTLWGRNRRLAFHTGFELQFSSFPTIAADDDGDGNGNGGNGNGSESENGAREEEEETPKFTDFADSYTGSLVFIYQPGWNWTHSYSDTSHNSDSRLHYDAIRHGITGRISVISRDIQDENEDTDILSARLGYLFTHHQTAASEAMYDDVNVFPMRFVEISYAYYESLFGREDADRLIVEAGLRVPGLGTNSVPFYGGVYLNAGKGQDDFRIFAGFLFQLDRLVEAF